MLLSYTLYSIYTGYGSNYWSYAHGVVKHSCVVTAQSKAIANASKHYHPRIVYEYEIGGKKYIKSNIGNYIGFGNDKEFAEMVIEQYPKNSEIKVFYCPYINGVSVLIPGMKQKLAHGILLLTGFVIVLGAYPVLFTENPNWFIDKIFELVEYVT